MRNAARRGVTRYRESPLGRAHVHAVRLLAVYLLLILGFTAWVLTVEYLIPGTPPAYSPPTTFVELLEKCITAGAIIAPLQAVAVVVLWRSWEVNH